MNKSDLLLGELREFKRATLERLDSLENVRLHNMEKKIDSLQKFKIKLMSVASIGAFLATLLSKFLSA